MNSIEKYQCLNCRKIHNREDDANSFCPNIQFIFTCGKCETPYENYVKAEDCCVDTKIEGEE